MKAKCRQCGSQALMPISGICLSCGHRGARPTAGSGQRKNTLAEALRELLHQEGRDLLRDPQTLQASLLDWRTWRPEDRRDIRLLLQVLKEGCVEQLERASDGTELQGCLERNARQLHANSGTDPALARLALATWVLALGRKLPPPG